MIIYFSVCAPTTAGGVCTPNHYQQVISDDAFIAGDPKIENKPSVS